MASGFNKAKALHTNAKYVTRNVNVIRSWPFHLLHPRACSAEFLRVPQGREGGGGSPLGSVPLPDGSMHGGIFSIFPRSSRCIEPRKCPFFLFFDLDLQFCSLFWAWICSLYTDFRFGFYIFTSLYRYFLYPSYTMPLYTNLTILYPPYTVPPI